jgi:hypothetical protein
MPRSATFTAITMKKVFTNQGKYIMRTKKVTPAIQSLRYQAFLLFDLGKRPSDLKYYFKIRANTAYRYFQQWKNTAPWLILKYPEARKYFRRFSPAEKRMLGQVLAGELNCPLEEILEKISRPWALKQIINGEWMRWQVTGNKSTGINVRKLVQSIRLAGCREELKQVIEMALNTHLAPDKDNIEG